MPETFNHSLLLAVLAATLLLGGAVLTVAGATVVTLDGDTGLTEDSAVDRFQDKGYIEVSHVSPKMTFTVAEQSEDVGVDGIQYTNFDTIYLRVSHEESIERTVRFYVPEGYWHAHPDEIDAVDSNLTAQMEPTGTGASAIEIHFEGEESGVFPVKRQASLVFSARDYSSAFLENETGITIPDFGVESDGWEYVPMNELSSEDPTFGIDPEGDSLTLQYDAANSTDPTGKEWRPMPSCGSLTGGDAPVCSFEQEGGDRIYVMSQVEHAPDVRFKHSGGLIAQLKASIDEAVFDIPREAIASAKELVDNLLSTATPGGLL